MDRVTLTVCLLFIVFFTVGCGSEQETSLDEDHQVIDETPEEPDVEVDEETKEDQTTDSIEEEESLMEESESVGETEPVEDEEKRDDIGDYSVYMGGEMLETEDQIIIYGESNLLPGARIFGEILVGDEDDLVFFNDTSEIVQENGEFYIELDNHNLGEETIVRVRFHFDGQQDQAIIRHYGDRGQNLEGPYIYRHQGQVGGGNPQNIFNQAMVVASFEPSEEKAIRHFREANWHPIPEDMGDVRVWIEVDEINNDGEFYYLQGRSNLSEGATIFVSFGNRGRQDETRILPDGSFYLKVPYEYKEDSSFTIRFDPSHFTQWNETQERYGSRGQKLVGNLVVPDKYSDKQFIETYIEQESTTIDVPDNVELTIDGSEVTMLVPDNVLFDFDEYELKNSSKETLDEIGETLKNSFNKKDFDIVIYGHTDNIGNDQYNLDLSKKRADEVRNYLEDQLDSSEVTFTTEGLGADRPIASNDSEEGQAKNRRVEIVINLK
ncbi:OmpA family protein [Halalkalibacter sp. APA_J-10(15)]|uniref:OmpA family protein n=1 Tax=Halalkalibacter sp. APA_J-10(15) TaxID=2933805 RepID=UPI001FF1F9D0|nr:OmpA family protein [Halalkalibacter sp. APA_J-10(15)]MCK0471683.1 OmpA family protein [Halalkalibacter sp. APA_J-10(15)]